MNRKHRNWITGLGAFVFTLGLASQAQYRGAGTVILPGEDFARRRMPIQKSTQFELKKEARYTEPFAMSGEEQKEKKVRELEEFLAANLDLECRRWAPGAKLETRMEIKGGKRVEVPALYSKSECTQLVPAAGIFKNKALLCDVDMTAICLVPTGRKIAQAAPLRPSPRPSASPSPAAGAGIPAPTAPSAPAAPAAEGRRVYPAKGWLMRPVDVETSVQGAAVR